MKKKSYEEVKQIFSSKGCELLEDKYKNNSTKMVFICKCGNAHEITLNQFLKSPKCNKCGIKQMKKSKDKGQQPCRKCDSKKNLIDRKTYGNICKECYNKYHAEFQAKHNKEYYVKHRDKRLKYGEKRRAEKPALLNYRSNKAYYKTRVEVLGHYSPDLSCVHCGFDSHLSPLSIDHVNGDGSKHRKEMKKTKGHSNIYYWLKRNNFPDGFQVLCMNCQFIKRYENDEAKRN
tara:strand:+ start:10623 stop:11318 length:696 start_codon:yes stop_codon:yes gene_type:complete